MKFAIVDNCPVPARLGAIVRELKRRSGQVLNSCDRSSEAEPLLRKFGKRSQLQLWNAYQNDPVNNSPANPPGKSTHERRNDGVAYFGPAGMPLRYWQVGMDWGPDSEAVVRAARTLGYIATRTYPSSGREYHHLNFRREPVVKLRSLKRGSKGRRVARMTKMLTIARDSEQRPYLEVGKGIFDEDVEKALRRFQRDWGQRSDGVYGAQSARQLAVAVRAAKRTRRIAPPREGAP